jgi:hypothetical protein
MATIPYQLDATSPTIASIATKVPGDTCSGAAEANTAAKKAMDFGLPMLVMEWGGIYRKSMKPTNPRLIAAFGSSYKRPLQSPGELL